MSFRLLHTLLFLLPLTSGGQIRNGLTAEFLFNEGDIKTKGSIQPKIYGAQPTEDRFGNRNCALYLLGNPDSYINLGSDTILKPREATISLWLKIDQVIYKGSGIEVNPIITTLSHAG